MNYLFRPLGPWIEPVTRDRWGSHRFKAKWSDTLGLLGSELLQLGATDVVFQVDVREAELRQDGMLRANVKVGDFPGVRVSFDSIHGPLTYATDRYEQQLGWAMPSWQANIRAITLALQALRAVDRYGVSGRGEQYRGWTAISNRPAEMSREQAAEFIAHWSGLGSNLALLSNEAALAAAYRAAAKRAHPDVTGDDGDTMARLNTARDLLMNGGGRG